MPKKNNLHKILSHVEKEEIINKLLIGLSPKDINEWLNIKYGDIDKKLVLSENVIKNFQENHLDIYNTIKEDLQKTKTALANGAAEEELNLTLQGSSTYKNKMIELANQEIDIKKMITNALSAIETRASQVFDEIQTDPRNIGRTDRVLIEWFDVLGSMIEKYYKIVEQGPDQIVQHNISIQAVDQHVAVIYEAIKETLAQIDLESSLRFMELFNEKMSRLKPPVKEAPAPPDVRMAEARVINEAIGKRLNDA